MHNYLLEYYEEIKSGKILVGEELKNILEGLIKDLDNPKYTYDLSDGNLRIEFIEKFCKHTKSPFNGKPFILELWEKGVFSNKYDENEYNSFYESTIEPIAIQLSEAFSLGLLTDGQLERGEQILFFSERLQYASWQTKVNAIGKLIGLGIMSLNESRNLLGLEPVEGGDKRLQSLNYVDATKVNLYQVGEKDEDTS